MNRQSLDVPNIETAISQTIDNYNSQAAFPWESEQNQIIETPSETSGNIRGVNNTILRISDFGGIILPENTDKNSTYHIVSIDLDPYPYKDSCAYFNFSCNVETINAQIQLKFQLYKQEQSQTVPLPVGAAFNFIRMKENTQTDVFSLTSCDQNLRVSNYCNYSVCIEVMGFNTVGTIIITNPILTALII